MMKNAKWNLVSFIFFYIWSSVCFCLQYETSENLRNQTKEFLTKNIHLNVNETMNVQVNLPEQLRVPVCTKGITASFPQEMSAQNVTAVELSCSGDAVWHTFIPVYVEVSIPIVVAKHPLSPKDIISENDLAESMYDKNRLFGGYYKSKEDVMGLEVTSPINTGSLFTKQNLQRPILVHRNQSVDITATRSTIVVTTKGIAKSEGRMHEMIKAYNPATKKSMDAMVVGENKVEVIG